MQLSTHYYVISLDRESTVLYEAFRDSLIDVQNQGFPVDASAAPAPKGVPADPVGQEDRLRAFLRIVDERFGHYYDREPLVVVVTGEPSLQTAFASVTTHSAAVAGRVDGDFTSTSLRDLGKIVWPLVKEAMTGSRERVLRELETADDGRKTCGLVAVGRRVNEAVGATLLVEEDYHVRGSISEADGSPTISSNVDVRDEIDDVIDMVIEKVLGSGGHVIFVPCGSLSGQGKIVLLLDGTNSARFEPADVPLAGS